MTFKHRLLCGIVVVVVLGRGRSGSLPRSRHACRKARLVHRWPVRRPRRRCHDAAEHDASRRRATRSPTPAADRRAHDDRHARLDLVVAIRAVGMVRADETRLTDVNVKVDGWIRELSVDYTGQPVAKGQPLFSLVQPRSAGDGTGVRPGAEEPWRDARLGAARRAGARRSRSSRPRASACSCGI